MFVFFLSFAYYVVCIYALERRGDLVEHGPFAALLNSGLLTCDQDQSVNLDVSGITVYFFDFAKNYNKSFAINDAAKGILGIESLDKTRQFIMFVGGFTSNINHEIEKQMREAYKIHPNSYLIIPDHSVYTNDNQGSIKGYERSVTHIRHIGKALGQMWANLRFGGISAKNIHCVGHSLGGQILGHVGSTFFDLTGEKISRLSALDPAGPCFTNSTIKDHVRSGLADYVEVYHCNSGALGSSSMLGDIDFIVNNGKSQPNCKTSILPILIRSGMAASCAHRVCVNFWTASVKKPLLFTAHRCESYETFIERKCETNNKTLAGPANPGSAKGMYFFSTATHDLNTLK